MNPEPEIIVPEEVASEPITIFQILMMAGVGLFGTFTRFVAILRERYRLEER